MEQIEVEENVMQKDIIISKTFNKYQTKNKYYRFFLVKLHQANQLGSFSFK